MPLSDVQVERYARQVILPEVGAGGQARLLESTVVIVGHEGAAEQARRYARATGFRLGNAACAPGVSCVIVVDPSCLTSPESEAISKARCPLVWYSIAGGHLHSGVRQPGQCWPPPAPAARFNESRWDELLYDAGACDAVATAVAVTLGWQLHDLSCEAELA